MTGGASWCSETGWSSTSVLSFMLFGVSSTSSTASFPEVGSVRIGGNSHNFLFVCLLIWFVGTESFFLRIICSVVNQIELCVFVCLWVCVSCQFLHWFSTFFYLFELGLWSNFKKKLCVSTTLVFAVELFCPLQSFTNTPIIQVCYTETLQLILSALTKTPSAQ